MQLLDFLSRTGGIKKQKKENNQFSIHHVYPRIDIKNTRTEGVLSQLKNPLILVNNLSISPTKKGVSVITKEYQEWSMSITLTFYIRGVSGDHLNRMDHSLTQNLGHTQPGALIASANKLLDMCQKNRSCTEENKISDIITVLSAAKDAYKSILAADKTSTPLTRVKRRSDLMTTVASIQNKLNQIEEYQKNNP